MKHKNKIKRLETRRADFHKMLANMNENQKRGVTEPGSLKK